MNFSYLDPSQQVSTDDTAKLGFAERRRRAALADSDTPEGNPMVNADLQGGMSFQLSTPQPSAGERFATYHQNPPDPRLDVPMPTAPSYTPSPNETAHAELPKEVASATQPQVAEPGKMPPPAISDIVGADPTMAIGQRTVSEPYEYRRAVIDAMNAGAAPSVGRKIAGGVLGALGAAGGANPTDIYRFVTQSPACAQIERTNPELAARHAAQEETLQAFHEVAPQVTSRFGTASQAYSAQQQVAQEEADRAQREREQSIVEAGVPGEPGAKQPMVVPRFSQGTATGAPASPTAPGGPNVPGAAPIGAPILPAIKGESAMVKLTPQALASGKYGPNAAFVGINVTKKSDNNGNIHYTVRDATGKETEIPATDVLEERKEGGLTLAPKAVNSSTGSKVPDGIQYGDKVFPFNAETGEVGKIGNLEPPEDVKSYAKSASGSFQTSRQLDYDRQDEVESRQQENAIATDRAKVAAPTAAEDLKQAAAATTLATAKSIKEQIRAKPDIIGPVIGNLETFFQTHSGTSFGLQDPKKAAAAATLAQTMLNLLGNEYQVMFPGCTSPVLFNEYKSVAPQLFQDPSILQGFLMGAEQNAMRNADSARKSIDARLVEYDKRMKPTMDEIERRRAERRGRMVEQPATAPSVAPNAAPAAAPKPPATHGGFSIISRG